MTSHLNVKVNEPSPFEGTSKPAPLTEKQKATKAARSERWRKAREIRDRWPPEMFEAEARAIAEQVARILADRERSRRLKEFFAGVTDAAA